MIKNEREYRITRAAVAKFDAAIAKHEAMLGKKAEEDPKIRLVIAGEVSFRDRLQGQVDEYEQVRTERFDLASFDSLDAIPRNLICARIALGWTHKELAKRLGTTEQQIQKYEATDYESASFRKISEIVSIFRSASQ